VLGSLHESKCLHADLHRTTVQNDSANIARLFYRDVSNSIRFLEHLTFLCSFNETNWYERCFEWRRVKKHTPEQIVSLLQEVEVAVSSGKTSAQASKEASTTSNDFLFRP
jgi:hypothetical protein